MFPKAGIPKSGGGGVIPHVPGIADHPGLGAIPVAPLQGAGYRLTARSQGFADGKPSDSTLGCLCLSPPGM